MSTNFEAISTELGENFVADIDQLRGNFDQVRGGVDRTWPILGDVGQIWAELGSFGEVLFGCTSRSELGAFDVFHSSGGQAGPPSAKERLARHEHAAPWPDVDAKWSRLRS